jgi:excisionase family DNA binding protein
VGGVASETSPTSVRSSVPGPYRSPSHDRLLDVNPDSLTVTVEEAAALLGIGRRLAYELIRSDEFPTTVIRLGRRIVVPAAPLLELLGHDTPQASVAPAGVSGGSCAKYHEHGSILDVEPVT